MPEAIAELEMLATWVRKGDYNRDDARDEIARCIENRIRCLKAQQPPGEEKPAYTENMECLTCGKPSMLVMCDACATQQPAPAADAEPKCRRCGQPQSACDMQTGADLDTGAAMRAESEASR